MSAIEYIPQVGPGMCCVPIAMCNALRFWGYPSPEPGTHGWNTMVDIAGCRHGAAISPERVSEWLSLVACPISLHFLRRGELLPAMMSLRSPDGGLHAALVIDTRDGTRELAPDLSFVNYRYDSGPLLEWVPWDDVAWDDGNRDEALGFWLVPRWQLFPESRIAPH